MIGLMFLAAVLAWLALSAFLALKLPQWLGTKSPGGQWATTVAALALFLVGPFVDEIVGMRQFERLCSEARLGIKVASDIGVVKRGYSSEPAYVALPGYWIDIRRVDAKYVDLDSGRPFLEFQEYFTKGGRLWGLLLLGGEHACQIENSEEFRAIWNRFELKKVMDEGYKK